MWGVTGMVLAVPMTAVARIYLASVEHPLLRYLASVLAGTADELGGVGGVGGVGGAGGGAGVGRGGGVGVELEAADELAREIEQVPAEDPLEGARTGRPRVIELALSNPNW